jgi:hypothetical protein
VNDISNLDTNQLKNAGQILLFEEWASLTDPDQTVIRFLDRHFRTKQTFIFYENFNVHRYKKQKAAPFLKRPFGKVNVKD